MVGARSNVYVKHETQGGTENVADSGTVGDKCSEELRPMLLECGYSLVDVAILRVHKGSRYSLEEQIQGVLGILRGGIQQQTALTRLTEKKHLNVNID